MKKNVLKKNVIIGLCLLICISIPVAQGSSPSVPHVTVATDGSGNFNCNGISDQIEINKALQYAKNNDIDTVYLKSGTYIIDNSIKIPSHMTLTGDKGATVELIKGWRVTRSDMFTPMITSATTASSDITISGFTINGNRYDQDAIIAMREVDSFPAIQLFGSQRITVKDMVIKDIAGDGIKLHGGKGHHRILNNTIHDTGHDDIFLKSESYVTIDGNTLSRVAADCGIRLDNCANMLVTNNTIWTDKNALFGVSGIYLLKHNNPREIYNVTIAYNTIYDTREMGIVLAIAKGANNLPTTYARDVHIHNNIIYGAGTNYRIGYPYGGGIWLDGWTNTIIENNVIDGCMGDGIAYGQRFANTQSATYTTIVRNNIITNTVESPVLTNDGYGINNRLGSNYRFVLENNVFWNNANGNYRNVNPSATDLNVDPLFADRSNRDYHLKSAAGRWTGNSWVFDTVTSPAIDAGSPKSDYSKEPAPNGNRINIGRYGNTAEASRSPSDEPIIVPEDRLVYDNRLREASPDAVIAGSNFIDVGHLNGIGRYRDVMWFDLSEYDTADKIDSAILSLYWYYPSNTARGSDTIVEIYRPAEWDQEYVSWNNRVKNTPWDNAGGDWFDRNDMAQGSTPYASMTFRASDMPDNRYHEFDVTELVQEYVNGNYDNTGFFLKAKDESNNYIAFYSSDWSNPYQRPGLNIVNSTAHVNRAPELNTIGDRTVNTGEMLSFTVTASDADDDVLIYSASPLPEGAIFDTTSGSFSWIPVPSQTGNYTITFEVTDGQDTDSETISVTVNTGSSIPPERMIYDNRLREASPNTVIAGSNFIDVGHLNGVGRYRDVMWFDLSEYDTADEIGSATLSLYWYYPANSTRGSDTIVEIYRPAEWDQEYVSWNNRVKNTPWDNAGGDWFDRNDAAQGSAPYASVTFKASDIPDNGYHEFDVTGLVRDYISGKHENTGFFMKAKDENNNYIAFYSSGWSNLEQRPSLNIVSPERIIHDNRLREASPDAVIAGSNFIDVGHLNGVGRYRDVMWFDLSEYDTADEIGSATLSLYWYYPSNTARGSDTIVEIYRPADWNPEHVSWNSKDANTPWDNPGGDWFDKNGISQGDEPYASITFNAGDLPDNRHYEFDVTELVQDYVNGEFENTGFFLKARDENNNYIAFYSSDWDGQDQRPQLNIDSTISDKTEPVNRAPIITLFEPVEPAVFEEGSTVNINVGAVDAEGDELSYSIAINGKEVSTSTSYEWYLDYASAGSHVIEVTVSDGVNTVTSSRNVSVTDVHP